MRILIIDISAVAYRTLYSMGNSDLCSSKGIPTSIIYGLFNDLLFWQRVCKPDTIVFACDSKNSKRREIYPEYNRKRAKKKKEKTPKEKRQLQDTYKQIVALRRKILPYIGFKNIFFQPGYEADDIIASLVRGYPNSDITAVCRDKDMYQLLSPHFNMYDPTSKKFYTARDFKKDYGILPSRWGEVKRLAGCSTDNVAGIEGVGERKAIKYLLGKQPKGKILDRIESPEGRKIFKRNKDLVVLPFKGVNQFDIIPNKFNPEKFKKVCIEFEFRSILMNISDYKYK